jgi:hypothetical protein
LLPHTDEIYVAGKRADCVDEIKFELPPVIMTGANGWTL